MKLLPFPAIIPILLVIAVPASAAAQTDDSTKPARNQTPPPEGSDWKPMFDGKTLSGWKSTNFGGEGDVSVSEGSLVLDFGTSLTGVNYTREFPKTNYEVRLEAQRADGSDFFCGMTFPVGDSFCSWIVGGWGGGVIGLSSIDGMDASENETTTYMKFNNGQWYRLRLRVTPQKIQAWIDDKQMIDQDIEGRKVSTRSEVDLSRPFGFATWETRGAVRNIQYRTIPAKPESPTK